MLQQPRDELTLQQALDKLLNIVSSKANEEEEVFFEGIQEQLCQLCDRIAEEIGADSTAVFFVTEDNPPGSKPFMVMRGASGRLRNTFDEWVDKWQEWREQQKEKGGERQDPPDFNGFAYPSKLPDEFLESKRQPQKIKLISRQVAREWSTTNQIWHLAEGLIANSNRAMDELHGGPGRTGRGDTAAYPGTNLLTTFRTMLGVPIFVQGGSIQTVRLQEEQTEKYPASASSRAEFLSKYRVIGILKVEGKQPSYDDALDEQVLTSGLDRFFDRDEIIKELTLSDAEEETIREWCKDQYKDTDSLKAVFGGMEGTAFPDLLQDKRQKGDEKSKDEKRKALLLRKGIADIFTRCCHAEFTRQDMELLVLLAMQVGRLTTRRVMKHAADKGIVISETELGLLNVRWRDINHLAALRKAAEAAKRKVEYHLEALKAELDFYKRQEVFRARVSELLDPHGPIREVTARCKEFISLVRKLVRKQRHLEDELYICEVSFTNFKCEVEGYYGSRSGEQCTMRGSTGLFIHRPAMGSGKVDITMKLGIESAPQVTLESKDLPVALNHHQNIYDLDLPLVHRILDKNVYHVDDLAGARVITDYDSDIDEVLDELQIRVGEWGVGLGKVDDMREGRGGGYRAVHVALQVDVRQLLPDSDIKTLQQALGSVEEQLLQRFPVEIQLRTAYQHSWALKTHAISYKREEQISQELRDEQEILANVLAQADWLSDIVRSSIENMLLPPDYGEHRLLDFLKRRVPCGDMNLIKFGIACAKEILKDQLRYNGQPEYSFAMEVCERLVYNFGVIDPKMLLLALLRNVWRTEHDEADLSDQARRDHQLPTGEIDIAPLINDLNKRLKQICPSVWDRYCKLLPLPLVRGEFRDWFWVTQAGFRDYFRQPPEDQAKQWKERLRNIYYQLKNHHRDEKQEQEPIDQWLERAYLMEAAILLANLAELPFEPGTTRRKRLHNDHLSLYREIRKYFPNGPTKTHVIEELNRAFREMETLLDLPRESEWWGQ